MNAYDPTGTNLLFGLLKFIRKMIIGVLVISNSESDRWKSESNKAASKLGLVNSCCVRQVDAETSSFSTIWECAQQDKVLIQTHGSPSLLSGKDFRFGISDAEALERNNKIYLVIMTSCRSGGDNGDSPNMGQVLSTKINPDGYLICSSTIVSGNSSGYTATESGLWNVYQNGQYVTSLRSSKITMETVQIQLYCALFEKRFNN